MSELSPTLSDVTLAENQPPTVDPTCIGVAASGGGVRAALFTAGALFAVSEYANANDRRVVVSTVSGSSLLALEVAHSPHETDAEALRQVVSRVVRYGYWPGKRLWVLFSVLATTGSVVGASWFNRDSSAAETTLWAAYWVTLVAVLIAALFRSQGIWYRRAKGLSRQPRLGRSSSIYRAMPDRFPAPERRRLLLDSMVFNATSLTEGSCHFFQGSGLPANVPVRAFAEASAAFPGVFMASKLPNHGDHLFADGGVVDNTGTLFFTRSQCPPHTVIALDAGLGVVPPPRHPYRWLNSLLNRVPRALFALTALLLASAVAATLTHAAWLVTASGLFIGGSLTVVALALPVAFVDGAVSDLRWLGRGWPITLRAASEERLVNAAAVQRDRGGVLTVVRLRNAARAKTQLWPLDRAVAFQVLREGYREASAALGHTERPETNRFLGDHEWGRAGNPTTSPLTRVPINLVRRAARGARGRSSSGRASGDP